MRTYHVKEGDVLILGQLKFQVESDGFILIKSNSSKLSQLLDIIAKLYNITVKQLRSKSRTSRVSEARFLYFYAARNLTHFSWSKIAREVNRDHSTASFGAAQFEIRASVYKNLLDKYETCVRTINKLEK